jgi:drug/metabolite transporter (DMT)-like permease
MIKSEKLENSPSKEIAHSNTFNNFPKSNLSKNFLSSGISDFKRYKTDEEKQEKKNINQNETLQRQNPHNRIFSYTNPLKSIYLLMVSIIFTSLTLLFIKILFSCHSKIHNSANSINFFCGLCLFIFSLIFLKVDQINLDIKKNFNKSEFDFLLIRSLLGFFSIYFTIVSLENMRLNSAVSIIYLSPMISTYIIMLKNREKFKPNDKIFFIFALFVIFIFLFQDFDDATEKDEEIEKDSAKGVVFSLIAAGLNSINNILDKKVCAEFHSYVILFVTGAISIILSPIFMAIYHDRAYMSTRNLSVYILLGVSCFFKFYFTHKSIEINSFIINSPIQYLTIGLTYVYSFLIFDEPITFYDVFASGLIILINFYSKSRMEDCEDDETN